MLTVHSRNLLTFALLHIGSDRNLAPYDLCEAVHCFNIQRYGWQKLWHFFFFFTPLLLNLHNLIESNMQTDYILWP